MKKCAIICVFIIITCAFIGFKPYKIICRAESLNENIDEQLDNIDLTEISDYFENLNENGIIGLDFIECVKSFLSGNYSFDYSNVFGYIFKVFFSDVYNIIPSFLSIIAISVLCGIVQGSKSKFLSESVTNLIFLVSFLCVILILLGSITSMYNNVKNIIENIAILCEIMSPIIITLMITAGGNVSASVYKPTVAFLSGGFINIILYAVLPLIAVMTVLSVVSDFSTTVKLKKFTELVSGVIKWIIGISCAVFGLFLSVQGISGATFDGISLKAAKYAISNSIPLVGGFIKDGFDLIIAGSILIKNSIGLAALFGLFYMLMSPIIYLAAFSLLLKLVSALTETICDCGISGFCTSVSKGVTYLVACLFAVGLMFFITVLLMIFSANAFI